MLLTTNFSSDLGMFGMRNFRYRYTEKIIPILSVYRFSFDHYKGKFFNGNLKEILSNSKRENDNFEAVSNMFRTTRTQCKISLKWKVQIIAVESSLNCHSVVK
jgi:hypothetical protein